MQAAGGTSLSSAGSAGSPGSPGPPGSPGSPADQPRRVGILLVVTALAWAGDLATKVIAAEALADGQVIEVIPHVLDLVLVKNPGAAFGIASAYTPILAIVMIGVIGVILRIARKLRSVPWAFALGLLLAGAFGNLTDRLFREPGFLHGHVIDFLRLPNWPVFNLADTAICVASGLIILLTVRGRRVDGTRESDGVEASAESSQRTQTNDGTDTDDNSGASEAGEANEHADTGTISAVTTETGASVPEATATEAKSPDVDEEPNGPCDTPSNGGVR